VLLTGELVVPLLKLNSGPLKIYEHTFTLDEAMSITPTDLADATEGAPYSEPLTVAGGKDPYSWAVTSGQLPEGLTLDSTTGVISGTPTSSGDSTFEVTVKDKLGSTETEKYSLTVTRALTIKPATLSDATEGTSYQETLTAEGGEEPYTWAVTEGTLPEGLGLDPSTGVISGTPSATGTSDFGVTVTDKNGETATAAFSLVVNQGSHQCASVCAFRAPDDGVTLVFHESVSAAYEYFEESWIDGVRENCRGMAYGFGCSVSPTLSGIFAEGEALRLEPYCQRNGDVTECTWSSADYSLGLLPGEVIYFEVIAAQLSDPTSILLGTSNAVTIE
jgi:hypothetical protein